MPEDRTRLPYRHTGPRRPWGSLMVLAVILFGGLLLDTSDGERVHLRGLPVTVLPEACWSKTWLGWNCPLCGATRSVIYLMRGHWEESWRMQPAGILTIMTAMMSAAAAWGGYWYGQGSRWIVGFLTQGLWIGLLVFLISRHAWNTIFGAESSAKTARAHAVSLLIR